jgi:hypothetical protein
MSFGPPLKSNHTEKSWPPLNKLTRYEYIIDLLNSEFMEDICFGVWLLEYKFYGAEWQEELD